MTTDVEDVYPLTPMQQAMLLQALRAPDSGLYVTQVWATVAEPVDLRALRGAFTLILRRHAALRSAFVWRDVPSPVQLVVPPQALAFDIFEEDWRATEPAQQELQLQHLLEEDRKRAYELLAPPLMRVWLLRCSATHARLVWSCSHLLVDGWSQAVLLRELAEAYRQLHRGGEPLLPPAVPLRRYHEFARGLPLEESRGFWIEQLSGTRGPTRLGIEEPGGGRGTPGRRGFVRHSLAPSAVERLLEYARTAHLTPATLLSTAWAALLSRYAGSETVTFGMTVSGRAWPLEGIDRVVGLLINAVPMVCQLDGSASAHEWMRGQQARLAQAQRLGHHAAATLREWAQLRTPTTEMFDSLLVVENFPLDASSLRREGGLQITELASHDENHDGLTVTVFPRGTSMEVEFSFEQQRYERSAIERLARQYELLLQQLCEPGRRMGELELWTPSDREELERLERGPRRPPEARSVGAQLLELATSAGGAVAVTDGTRQLTWAELSSAARALASELRQHGVGPEVLVPVVCGREVEAVIAISAVWLAGGVFCPVGSQVPPERARLILTEAGAQVVLAGNEQAAELARRCGAPRVLRVDIPRSATAEEARAPTPEQAAYVIFTSGTTGKPKGVVVEHQSLAHVVSAWQEVYRLDELVPRVLQVGSFAADVFIGDWLKVLYGRGCLILCPDSLKTDPRAVHRLLSEHEANLLESTPGFVCAFFDYLYRRGLSPRSLQLVILGADYLRTEELRLLLERFGKKIRFVNGYGLTECTIESSLFESDAASLEETPSGYVGLGRPFPNVEYQVLGPNQERRPIGAAGELYIAGPLLARGYSQAPELTRERFLAPAGAGPRLFKTGDLVRWDEAGQLQYLGRADHMVKVRGFRVEIGEVENALLTRPGVREAAVVYLPGSGELAAALVADATCDVASVQRSLREKLPEYMVPGRISRLEALPRNANGKVDRQVLTQHFEQQLAAARAEPLAEGAAADDVEHRLLQVWRELLANPSIGLDDSFMTAGGNSLKVLQLFNRIHELFGVEVQVADLFGHHTVRSLAQHLQSLMARSATR